MFKKLVDYAAVSGMEDDIRNFIQGQLQPHCHSIKTDGMGNLHAMNHGEGPQFLLVTYMDEPGVIVTRITEDGYLCFETVGRINPAFLASKHVSFGNVNGVISLKAIHLTTKKEREIPIKTSQLLIDIGASSKEEAEKLVEVGDYGTLDISFLELKNGFVKGRALAGRMGCSVAMEILKKNPNRNIHVIFAVQREIGNRGLMGCSVRLNADYTIVLDGIKAKDYRTDKKDVPESGKGVVIVSRHPNGILDKSTDEIYKTLANDSNIPIQYGTLTSSGAEAILIKSGHPEIISLSIPIRYFDSTAPIAHLDDMDGMERLINKLISHIIKEEEK